MERTQCKEEASLSFTMFADIDPCMKKHWLVQNMLGAGDLSCLFGAPGAAKSAMAIDLACHVAAGNIWLGRHVAQGAVLYVAAERAGLVKRRLAAFGKHHGLEKLPLAVIDGAVDLCSKKSCADAICNLADRLKGVKLIVIDTLSRALAGGDENSSKDMGAIVANLNRIQNATDAHVAVIHHVPHDGNRMRGHGALLAACDTTIKIERAAGTIRRATVEKANDGPEGEGVTFDLQSVTLTEGTTAPVLIPATMPEYTPKRQKLGPNEQAMLNILHDAGCPLTMDEWNDLTRKEGIGVNRPATLTNARSSLKRKGLVYEGQNGWSVT